MANHHQHLIVKAYVDNPPSDCNLVNEWLTRLVSSIGMKVCMEPRSIYCDVPGNRGLTGQVVIETSHICLHVWDEVLPALFQMDCYSCREFDPQIILDSMGDFGMVSHEAMLIDRNEGVPLRVL